MIIRSQNKKYIVNLDNIIEIAVHDKNVVCNGSYSHVGLLGAYSTEEKAIKVLDMIQDEYCRTEDVKCGAVQAQKYDSFCFNMPQDSEV